MAAAREDELKNSFHELPVEIRNYLMSNKLRSDYPRLAGGLIIEDEETKVLADQLVKAVGIAMPKDLEEKLLRYVLASQDSAGTVTKLSRARGATAMARSEEVAKEVAISHAIAFVEKERQQEVNKVREAGKKKMPCRNRRQRKLRLAEGDEVLRGQVEEEDKTRWTKSLADIIIEAGLPRYERSLKTLRPDTSMLRCSGSSRASTIRQRVRYWWKARFWLMDVHRQVWPTSPEHFINFVEALWDGGCPRTAPRSVL